MAHGVQAFRKLGTVSLTSQLRVCVTFVDIRSVKIFQPCLDVPAWDDHENRIRVISSLNPSAIALRVQLSAAGFRWIAVRVRDNDQVRALHLSNGSQLIGITFPHPLVACLPAAWKRKGPDVSTVELPVFQKAADECLGLLVLA